MVGGMNHFMLPVKLGERDPDVFFAARYGAAAMEFLINNLLHLGAQRDRLVAKAFGGGRVMRGISSDVGGQNVDFVRRFLRDEGIPLWSEDLGGPFPRKVYFFPHTGQVMVKRMERTNNDTIYNRELTYLQEFDQSSQDGDVELFS
jgi:chemotaxis protein CheD